jgi:predicted NBD/HSP70 family sugar kinase
MKKAVPPAEDRLQGTVTVLDYVRSHGSATRAALVHGTGLSRAVVTQRVAELIDYGLLTDGDLGPSTGGRAPRLVRFRADAGHLLVADLGATSVDVALADLSGAILVHVQEPCDIAAGPEPVLARVEELFVRSLVKAESRPGSLWGIGIGVPGPVEFDSGRPVAPPIMPGWDGYAVRERFAKYHVPVWVDNDVNVMALGEYWTSWRHSVDDLLFVKVATGIGCGIVAGGVIHRGADGTAGDIGHVQIPDAGDALCRCGNRGCVEAVASGGALARELRSIGVDAHDSRDVVALVRAGNAQALTLVRQAGRLVGEVLAGAVNFFNPSVIVIGGDLAHAHEQFFAGVREVVYRRSTALATQHLQLARSRLDDRAGVIGCAVTVVEQILSPAAIDAMLAPAAEATA